MLGCSGVISWLASCSSVFGLPMKWIILVLGSLALPMRDRIRTGLINIRTSSEIKIRTTL
ncbi:hypothetical protein BDV19DRAFT_368585, partial [Aspergillus venezuelensis]